MHDHNKDEGGKGMMWMMIPCLLLVGVLLLGSGKLTSGSLWPILIGGFVVLHVWMMFKGHGGHGKSSNVDTRSEPLTTTEKQDKNSEHKHGGCCH